MAESAFVAQSDGGQAARGRLGDAAQCRRGALQQGFFVVAGLERDRFAIPAQHVGLAKLERGQLPIGHLDQHAALGPRLAGVPALGIAGIDDVRLAVENLKVVHMAEGPIVVALGDQLFDRAGGVVVVVGVAAGIGVQQPDVETVGHGGRIVGHKILRHAALGIAHAVQGDRQRRVPNGLRPAVVEQRDIAGPGDLPGHFVTRVVIAQDQIDRNPGLIQLLQLGWRPTGRR